VLFFPFNFLVTTGENMTVITLVVLAALCLAFPPTRIYSVILTGLLLYIYPYVTLSVLVLAGIAFYFYRRTIA